MLARRKQPSSNASPPGSPPARRLPEGKLLLLAAHVLVSSYRRADRAKKCSEFLGFAVTESDIATALALREHRRRKESTATGSEPRAGLRVIVTRGKRLQ